MKQRDVNESAFRLGFVYTPQIVDAQGRVTFEGPPTRNVIPQVGVDHLVSLLRGTGSLISSWYVGVYEGNYVPTAATTAADIPTNAQESQAYSQASRPLWNNTYDGVSVITNRDNRAEFAFTADKRVYGAFLVSVATKGSGSGLVLSMALFASPYDIPAGSTFRLGVSIALVPSV